MLYSAFSFKNGYLLQIDDLIAEHGPQPVPPGPTPPGPTPPSPEVDVSITISGSIITIDATGDLSVLDGYAVNVYSKGAKVLSERIEPVETFDLDNLRDELPIGAYAVKVQAFDIDGNLFPESNSVTWYREPDERTIWIKFKFLDKSYNPSVHQLATGKACTRERKKSFSADWQLIDSATYQWLWGITSGTNLSYAFTTLKGEQSTPLIIADDWLDAIPAEMGPLDGYTPADCQALVNNGTWPIVPATEFTGHANIIEWDLVNATDLSNMFGAIPWVSGALYGDVPGFSSKADNMSQMFSRCYHVTSIGAVDASHSSQMVQVFYSKTGLSEMPELTVRNGAGLTYLFGNCGNIEGGIEEVFHYLDGTNPRTHENVFRNCGILADEHALDNIPKTWGGKAVLLGTTVDGNITPLAVGGKILRF